MRDAMICDWLFFRTLGLLRWKNFLTKNMWGDGRTDSRSPTSYTSIIHAIYRTNFKEKLVSTPMTLHFARAKDRNGCNVYLCFHFQINCFLVWKQWDHRVRRFYFEIQIATIWCTWRRRSLGLLLLTDHVSRKITHHELNYLYALIEFSS